MFTIDRNTVPYPTPLLDHYCALVAASRPVSVSRRIWLRVLVVTLGNLLALRRQLALAAS